MTAVATAPNLRTFRAEDRAEWRAWLQDNCATADEVWLVIQHAGSGTPGVRHRDAIEEALCFGWIDSLARKLDATSWAQRFTPRNPRGAWSNVNRELVERLTVQGLMTPHGQAAVDLAKRTGTWSVLADAQSGVVPDDLRDHLAADEAAARHFEAFPRSARRAILEWIARAKRPETRQRRVARTVECAARNERP
ncbi:YdeI/OmpD-associated family protein [Pseudonocardia xinjiangensis]|uniref:YdeI/OmpD-associated family protein n=1 Tax=Pseudonocardia xinjiangensis TaxID=75289 RepID=UPI0028A85034|nr:YdeI/OmpD-associated family protein [Pseudonocardia xinjiangensis]